MSYAFDDAIAALSPDYWWPGTNNTDIANGHNLTSGSALTKPTLLAKDTNYQKRFDFSNSSYKQTAQDSNYQAANFTLHAVYRPTAADIANGPWIISSCTGSADDTNFVLYVYPNNAGHNTLGVYLGGGVQFQPATIDIIAGKTYEIILEVSGASNPRAVKLTINDGVNVNTYTDNKNWGPTTRTISLGNQPGVGVQTTGSLQHVFWRNSDLSTGERNSLIAAFNNAVGTPNSSQAWVAAAIAAGATHVWAPGTGYLRDYVNPNNPDWAMEPQGGANIAYGVSAPSGFDGALHLVADSWLKIKNGIQWGYGYEMTVELVYRQKSGETFTHIINQQDPGGATNNSGSYQITAKDASTNHNYATLLAPSNKNTIVDAALGNYNQVFWRTSNSSAGSAGNMTISGGSNGAYSAYQQGYQSASTDPVQIGYRLDDTTASGGLYLCGIAVYNIVNAGAHEYPTSGDASRASTLYTASGAASWSPPVPGNTVAPATSGDNVAGFSTTDGTWSNSPSGYTYQWQISNNGTTGWSSISGETGNTLIADTGRDNKYIRCAVTATNADGTSTAYGNAVQVVTLVVNTVPPFITGNNTAGFTSDDGTWDYEPDSFTHQWQKSTNGGSTYTNISGATSSTLAGDPAIDGLVIRLKVTATNEMGSVIAYSNGVTALTPVVNTVAPLMSGDYVTGYSVTDGTWDGTSPTFTYQWQISEDDINYDNVGSATSAVYFADINYANLYVRCAVTATNDISNDTVYSNSTMIIAGLNQSTYAWLLQIRPSK